MGSSMGAKVKPVIIENHYAGALATFILIPFYNPMGKKKN